MKSFNDLKSNKESLLKKFSEDLANLTNQSQNVKDDRFWYPEVDKVGNGSATIRFLPPGPQEGEDVPFVRVYKHSFKGPNGSWYIENSLTTIGQNDPVSEYNSKLWNSGLEENKEIARKQKRKLEFISNIYVIKDPASPENEGKVFLFRYGKKLYDKLDSVMNPKFEDDAAINPFDLWEGANLKIRIRQKDGYRNYDESSFDAPGPLFKEEAKLESVWNQCYALQEFLGADQFKPYDQLKTKLFNVLGEGVENNVSTPVKNEKSLKKSIESAEVENVDMEYFKKFAEDDE